MVKWNLIDFNRGEENLLISGITPIEHLGRKTWNLEATSCCHIQNFPEIQVTGKELNNCTFESCGQVTFVDCVLTDVVFTNIDLIILDNSSAYKSTFKSIECSESEMLISMEDSTLSGCTFKDITLTNSAYLADGVGDCMIEACIFKNVITDRVDGKFFICREMAGHIVKRMKEYDMVDYESCVGYNPVDDGEADINPVISIFKGRLK